MSLPPNKFIDSQSQINFSIAFTKHSGVMPTGHWMLVVNLQAVFHLPTPIFSHKLCLPRVSCVCSPTLTIPVFLTIILIQLIVCYKGLWNMTLKECVCVKCSMLWNIAWRWVIRKYYWISFWLRSHNKWKKKYEDTEGVLPLKVTIILINRFQTVLNEPTI